MINYNIDSEGVDIDLKSIQFERMKNDSDRENNISSVPHTIVENIMMRVGFCSRHDPNICLATQLTANNNGVCGASFSNLEVLIPNIYILLYSFHNLLPQVSFWL